MKKFICLLLFLSAIVGCFSQDYDHLKKQAKDNGHFLLMGGGFHPNHVELIKRYGKTDSIPLLVIPTAFSDEKIARDTNFRKLKTQFSKMGFSPISVLHARDSQDANDPDFVEIIKKSTGVVLMGGSTEKLVSRYQGTQTEIELLKLLGRGGIIAGVSAGSGAQASYFSNHELITGFGFIDELIVMNHFFRRNKQFDHIAEIKNYPNYVSVGIDENTGIFVRDSTFEVVGDSYVAIYDGNDYARSNDSTWKLPVESERFYVLMNGDRYDLNNKMVITNKRLTRNPITLDALREYIGSYEDTLKNFSIELRVINGELFLINSWGWKPYPIFPYEKDIFFAQNRNMWFQFRRDQGSGEIIGLSKMKSILQQDHISNLTRVHPD